MGDERACPSCLAYVEREAPTAARVHPPDGAAALAIAPLEAEATEQHQEEPAHACPAHPQRQVAGVCARCGTFICRECDGKVEGPAALCPPCRAREDAALAGIGGWLIIPAIWCVVGPPVYAALTALGLYALTLQVTAEVAFDTVMSACMFALSTFTSVQFFRRKASVPALMIGLLLAQCLLAVIYRLDPDRPQNDAEFLRSVGALFIWGAYFLQSRRVKATFVR